MEYSLFSAMLGVDGKLKIGNKVWICDYRSNNIHEKPIRHIQPIEVFICDNDSLPKNKTVYYADVHFRPVGKGNKPTSRIIAPYDNTGFRARSGVAVQVFLSEKECRKHYKGQCEEIINKIEIEKVAFIEKMNDKLEEVNQDIKANT